MSDPDPAPPSPRLRRLSHPMRDMVLTVVVLAIGMVVLVAAQGGVSFAPGYAKVNQADMPHQNATHQLTTVAGDMPFRVRVPKLPAGWHSNSGDVNSVDGRNVVRTGWITPDDGYLRLEQSDAPAAALAADAAQSPGGGTTPIGTAHAGGKVWQVYPAVRNEKSWVVDAGGTRLLITGNATRAQFRALADAVLAARAIGGTKGD